MSHSHILILPLAFSALALLLLRLRRSRLALPLPPSIKGLPVFGHMFSLPSSNEYVAYRDISKQLQSDVISFTVLGQVIVVLNSIESAKDLLVKRSAIYSSRAEFPMLNDEKLCGWGNDTGFLPYGERWKKQRTMTQAVLNPNAGEELWPKMVKQVRLSMQRLISHPEGIASELRWMTSAIMLSSIYGYEASYPKDELVEMVEIASKEMSQAAMPANFFVNIIPWLKHVPSWFPGAGWKRKANEWRARKDRVIKEPFEWTRSQMAANKASPSMLKTLLTKMATNDMVKQGVEEEEDILQWVTGTLYVAGADTTVSSMTSFVLAMILHPEVQKKVRDELDSVVGERLPELGDREALPYLNAVLKEVMRWRPVGPFGIPHTCSKDDQYKGYRIPKDALVAMSGDSNLYPNPEDFHPDRYLDLTLPPAPIFGFGRRECPGSHFAQANFFLTASTLITVFNVTATPGKPFPEAKTQGNVLILHSLPFECTVTPRSESRQRLLEHWVEI